MFEGQSRLSQVDERQVYDFGSKESIGGRDISKRISVNNL